MVNHCAMRVVVRKKISTTNSWQTAADAIILPDAFDISVTTGLGKKKDKFNFRVRNPFKELFVSTHIGDGAQTDFNFAFSPIPTEHQSGSEKKLYIYIGGTLTESYTVINNDSTVSFDSAPADGAIITIEYPVIEEDDVVRIYRIRNKTAFVDADIIQEGTITTPTMDLKAGGSVVSVRGESFISQVFNGLVFSRPGGGLNRSHLYIQDIIAQINEFNQDRKIFGETSGEWTTLGNATTTKSIQYFMSYKSAIELIEDLSGNDYTGNGQYVYFLTYDATNDRYQFIWKAKPTAINTTLVEGTDAITSARPQKDNTEVVTAAIYNCGTDAQGNSMEFPYFDFTSSGGSGQKWKYITKTNTIGETIINNEFINNSATWEVQTFADGTKVRTSNYPQGGAYPLTMQFEARTTDNGALTGAAVSAANDTDFNDAIWIEARWQGWHQVKGILEGMNKPTYGITLTMDYGSDTNSSYTLGDVYSITLSSFGVKEKKLRLFQINYEITATILHFKEDEVTLDS